MAKNDKKPSEFERVGSRNKLKSWKSFLGMYAGEHAAGTEFMIGPLSSLWEALTYLPVYFWEI